MKRSVCVASLIILAAITSTEVRADPYCSTAQQVAASEGASLPRDMGGLIIESITARCDTRAFETVFQATVDVEPTQWSRTIESMKSGAADEVCSKADIYNVWDSGWYYSARVFDRSRILRGSYNLTAADCKKNATQVAANDPNCQQMAAGYDTSGNIQYQTMCLSADGLWRRTDDPEYRPMGQVATSTPFPSYDQHHNNSTNTPNLPVSTVQDDCRRSQDWARENNASLPRVEGGVMEIQKIGADCSQKLFTYNVRLLLDKSSIQSDPNFYRDLHLSTLDGQCDDEFITDKGWRSESIYIDKNYNRLSSISISNQDCQSHTKGAENPSVNSIYSGPPRNTQELSDRLNQAIPGVVDGMIKDMFGGIFGGGGNSSQSQGQECLPQQVCDAYGNCRRVYGGNSC